MAQLHSLLTAVHRPYAAIYADATARLAATGFIRALGGGVVAFAAEDLYKKALQLDDASEWVLTAITPTWVQVSGAGSLGDVVGPSSSVDSEIALFNSTTGKLLKRASATGLLKAASGVLSAAVAGTDYSVPTASVNAQTGTTYTLQASDNGGIVTCSNAGAITVTVPSGLGAGFNCLVIQLAAGAVTITGSGATINQRQGHTKTAGQYAVVTLVAYAANTFVMGGDSAA